MGNLAGFSVYKKAVSYIGSKWGYYNCTGFVTTVTNDAGNLFISNNSSLRKGAYDASGVLINNFSETSNLSYYVPISDAGVIRVEDNSDNWSSVYSGYLKSNFLNTLTTGDVVRFKHASGFYHSGVVAAYNEKDGIVYLIDNLASSGSDSKISVSSVSLSNINISSAYASDVHRLYTGNASTVNDIIDGDGANDTLGGGHGDDTISGGGGGDYIFGNSGNDKIIADADGRVDYLYGGSGSDTFIFSEFSTNSSYQYDVVQDFSLGDGDKIDLSAIDAVLYVPGKNTLTGSLGDQPFKFIGLSSFSKTPGELRVSSVSGGTLVTGDINGDGYVDFSMQISGVSPSSVSASYFIL
jgi:hypothetical protein